MLEKEKAKRKYIINPTKYTRIDTSILGISFEIIKILKKDPIQDYNQIFERIVNKKGDEAKTNFLLSLSFLYILKKIQYHKDDDVIEFLYK